VDIIEEARKVLRTEAEAVLALADRLNSDFRRAVEIISSCAGRVIVTGMGKSGLVGKKIAATLASTGTPAFSLHPAEASHGDLGMVTERDVVLAISNSGETEEIVSLIPYLKRFSVKLISMSGNAGSALARSADVNIDISVAEEACPMGLVPTASTTAALAMGDAIAVSLLLMKGFREEDFAAFHPKGSLGKKLLIKVGDLMHTGDAVPKVSEDAPLTETTIEISTKRLGMTIVVNGDGKLVGIVTDGDLRRGLQGLGQELFGQKAANIMSKNPKTIDSGELAAKALSIMEKNSITALIVNDDEDRPEGVIHLHDILKEGIA
jgi:arabinose-5-phosphate isomerase